MIVFSDHAVERLVERSLHQEQVNEAILHPDSLTSTRFGRMIAVKSFGKRSLKAVIMPEKDDIIVITAYWTRSKGGE